MGPTVPPGVPAVDRRRALGAGALGVSSLVLPPASAAASLVPAGTTAPAGTTSVEWSDGELFDAWSARTTTTSPELDPTLAMCWQPFQAHVDLRLAAGTADALGVATYRRGYNTWYWYLAVSTAVDTLGSFGAVVAVGSQVTSISAQYEAGGFSTTAPTETVDIPAGHHFLVGLRNGPQYRSFQRLAAPRTATTGGVPQLSVLDRCYYAPPGTTSTLENIPSVLGGNGGYFSEEVRTVAVISIRLRRGLSG